MYIHIADYTYERKDGEREREGRRERGVRKGGREREYNSEAGDTST